MPPRRVLLVLVALLAGVGAAALALVLVGGNSGRTSRPAGSPPTEPVSGPPVRLSGPDVTTGETIGLHALAEKPVVLMVWASWCRPCPRQGEPLRAFVGKHSDAAFLAVDTQEDADAARAFLAAEDLDVPTIADEDGRLAARLGVRELPTTLFLTSEHRVAALWEGPASVARLRAGLAAAKSG
jgi:cytochrome c biogenesis protein CcmG, thiol:disulfide interchange protein DsbE